MPFGRYRRRFRRRFRRRYGGRRRRPNAARATIRGTLAPRTQLLRLKSCFTVNSWDGTAADYNGEAFGIQLQVPSNPYRNTLTGAITGTSQGNAIGSAQEVAYARGWSAYQNLFNNYCVAGVKISGSILWETFNNTGNHMNFAFMSSPELSNTTVPAIETWGSLPLGWSTPGVRANAGLYKFKKYINMNRLFGEVVRRHDQFIHNWADIGSNPSGSFYPAGYFGIGCYRTLSPDTTWNYAITWNIKIVWYVHAMSVNTSIVGTVPSAMVAEMTEPMTEATMLGSIRDPTTTDYQQAVGSGVAMTKRGLEAAGQLPGARARISK